MNQPIKAIFVFFLLSNTIAITPSSANEYWWLIGEPSLHPGRPPLVAVLEPITSDQIYITSSSTVDILGKAASLSSITRVDWDSYNVDIGDFLAFGQATISDTDYALTKQWHQDSVPLVDGWNEITVIVFDARNRSTMERFVVIKEAAEELDKLFDEELAQKIEASTCVGDPIEVATGSQLLEHNLLTVKGVLPISLNLEYNSLLLKPSSFGKGWGEQHFNTRLEMAVNGNVTIHWTNNRYNHFTAIGSGQYAPDHISCNFDSLVEEDNGWRLTRKNGLVYIFNPQGQLIKFGNKYSQFIELTYNTEEQLIKITEPSGRYLQYQYTDNLISAVSDNAGHQVNFYYDENNNLIQIVDVLGQTTNYSHNEHGQIVSAIDSDEKQIFRNVFDEETHKLVEQYEGDD